jgi:quercetin dioxygenase-like cupin family protein
MNCKCVTILATAVLALSFIGGGCIAPDPEPQKRNLAESPQKVMHKDIYEVSPAVNKELGGAKYYTIFSNISEPGKGSYSISLAVLPPGEGLALHSLTSSEMILVISGGGVLKVNSLDYILKEGMAVYIPPGALQSAVNDSPNSLKFVTIISPAYNKQTEKILAPPPKPVPVAGLQDVAPSDENSQLNPGYSLAPISAADKLLDRTPATAKNMNLNGVQELTPQEQQVPINPKN